MNQETFHEYQTAAEKAYDEFWQFVESEAEKYEVTCDYYLMEFMNP